MKTSARHSLALSLLVLYGAIAVLGHGLHMLTGDHGHHHGLDVVSRLVHGLHCHSHSHCEEAPTAHWAGSEHGHRFSADCGEAGLWLISLDASHEGRFAMVRSTESGIESHDCHVCAFLAQARSVAPEYAPTVSWQQVLAAALPLPAFVWGSPELSPHAPRGPPALA